MMKQFIFFSLFVLACIIPVNLAYADHTTAGVSITSNSSVTGCDESSSCYMPYAATVDIGGEVTWSNDDSSVHTVTSGNSESGPDGIFDSSLIMSGETFSLIFNESGAYDYFCTIHPWMTGIVYVEDSSSNQSTVSITVMTDKESYTYGDTIVVSGKADSYIPDVPLYVAIFESPNLVADLSPLKLNSDNTYSISTIAKENLYEKGMYTVKVILFGGNKDILPEIISDEATFEFTTDSPKPQLESTTEYNVYKNEKYGFSLEYPSYWKLDEMAETDDNIHLLMISPSSDTFLNVDISWDLEYKKLQDQKYLNKMIEKAPYEKCEKFDSFDEDGFLCSNFKQDFSTILTNDKYLTYVIDYTYTDEYDDGTIVNRSEISFQIPDISKTWFITVTSIDDELYYHLDEIASILNSFTILDYEGAAQKNIETESENNEVATTPPKGGGCLIATATYGTELAPQVQQLRELRDNQLLQTESGTSFISSFNDFYYSFSPAIADWERENPIFKEAVKIAITPMLSTLSIMTLADDGSEDEVLGLGLSVIALNIGMYFVAPAVVIIGIRKKFQDNPKSLSQYKI